jgi:uncharacterized protein DUF4124/glutaredoxin
MDRATTAMTRRITALWVLLACALGGLPGAGFAQTAAQYRWIDRNGAVTFGDDPPRDARRVQQVAPSRATDPADAVAGLPYEVRGAAQRYPVVLYAAPNAPACATARDFLRSRGVPFRELTVTTQADVDELQRRGAGDRLPALAVGSQMLRQFEPGTWNAALDAAGYPASSQLPVGWTAPAAKPLVPPPAAPAATADAAPPPP